MLKTLWTIIIFQPMHNLLAYLFSITGGLGSSIFILIVFVRGIVMFPLTAKQFRDTKKVRSIQPRIEELKEKFKDKPTELAAAQQSLYKDIGYNPLGCATNFLIQIPIFIALYQSLLTFTQAGVTPQNMTGLYPFVSAKLAATGLTEFSTKLFGIELMTSPKENFANGIFTIQAIPYIILVLLMIFSNILPSIISQKLMNPQVPKLKKESDKTEEENMQESLTNSMNKSTLYLMPIMVSFMMIPLKSIILIYMITQSFVSTAQQLLIKQISTRKLRKDLTNILTTKYKIPEDKVQKHIEALVSAPAAINFLVDELAEFGEFKTTGVKIHDIPFSKVLKKLKNDPLSSLVTFIKMAKNPHESQKILDESEVL